ncbi:MAG: HAD hydrolase family protein [Gammaproteobacteria bacterium]|mgnify:CR=1 FL=1|nr:HAD hydrolase family protein [Gammaproteobacteria bacterium]
MTNTTQDIRLLALDVDGTLTDGGIYVLDSGEQCRKFNAKDGLGVKRAVARGLEIGLISHSLVDGAIVHRAKMMEVQHVYVGQAPKLEVLGGWCATLGLELAQVAYIGDDINDLPVLEAVGVAACPADAMERVKAICDVVLERRGGDGCVREFLERFRLLG